MKGDHMELKIDLSKEYGIALEGGGAKGSYQIGVWKAMDEIGVKYKMVSGTSVGALNGSLMVMHDLAKAIDVWSNIRISDVINTDGIDDNDMLKIVTGKVSLGELSKVAPKMFEIIQNKGLDVSPLRQWVRNVVDVKKIQHSDTEFFISTVSLSERKGKEVRINDLPDDEICNMLLASAYFPAFKKEKLNGQIYADGGFIDSIPIKVLVDHNCRDIIAVRLPAPGIEKIFKLPENTNLIQIQTAEDLGGLLEFDSERAKRNMQIGYFDAMRVFYGLYGHKYYIDRTLTEKEALEWLLNRYCKKHPDESLREILEVKFPAKAKKLGSKGGDYYDLFLSVLEGIATRKKIECLGIYKDIELLAKI